MFINFMSLLIAVSSLMTDNALAVSNECDRELKMEENFEYTVPSEYEGSNCRYNITGNRRNEMICQRSSAQVNESGCVRGREIMITDGSWTNSFTYCENKGLQYISLSNEITVEFSGAGLSGAKRFQCRMKPYKCEHHCTCPEKKDVYPMIAKLTDVAHSDYACTATIINEIQVLTAAHCVANRTIEDLRVHVGWFENGNVLSSKMNSAQSYSVESVQVHENWNLFFYDYNIAIVTINLLERIKFSETIHAVNLPALQREISVGDNVEILAWDSDDAGNTPDILKRVRMNVTDSKDCKPSFRGPLDGHSCATSVSEFPRRYSGGSPVLWKSPRSGKAIQIGITDPRMSSRVDKKVAYIRIDRFLDWISKNNNIHGDKEKKLCQV